MGMLVGSLFICCVGLLLRTTLKTGTNPENSRWHMFFFPTSVVCPLTTETKAKKSDHSLDAIFSRNLNMLASAVRNPRFKKKHYCLSSEEHQSFRKESH
jgi:hypothetical protein